MEGRCSLIISIEFGVKRSSALDIEVEICSLGCKMLSFPLKDTIPQTWTTHERKDTQNFIEPFLYPLRKGIIYTYQEFGG
jgi:hypothetical protein